MEKVLEDVIKSSMIAKGKLEHNIYGKIYYCSNERLYDLFDNFSVEDKDVLTVLASSDQYLHTQYRNARSVDTFDRNQLTLYYYYLRKWIIENFDRFYPKRALLFDTNNYIEKILDIVDCESLDEKRAYLFWKMFIDLNLVLGENHLFMFSKYIEENEINDYDKLREIVKKPLSFVHEDVAIQVEKDKKYDIIITSNLLEYIHEPLKIKRARNNLYDLLKDNGKIICSYVIDDEETNSIKNQKSIFSEYFDVYDFPYSGKNENSLGRPLGYCYTKK